MEIRKDYQAKPNIKLEESTPKHDIYNMEPCVAIISLNTLMPMPRIIYYSVTIHPDHFSKSKNFIRFGDVDGDEVMGWVDVRDIVIHEIEHKYAGEIPYIRALKAIE